MKIQRRFFVTSMASLALCSRPGPIWAAGGSTVLASRLRLLANWTRKNEGLLARYLCVRKSRLKTEPIVRSGQLVFHAPSILQLRDDGFPGCTTRIDRGGVTIHSHAPEHPTTTRLEAQEFPAARWISEHLLALFSPEGQSALERDAILKAPPGRGGPRLELSPPSGSITRRAFLGASIRLDPVSGAIVELEIREARGDQLRLTLSDHRQQVKPARLDALLSDPSPPR